MSSVEFNDNSNKILEEFHEACLRALSDIAEVAELHAKDYAPVDTGHLRASIHSAVVKEENAAYVGTRDDEVNYAKHQELGTYKMPAHPFLKPSIANHANEYRAIIEKELKDG